jgi:hypothetical protein
MEMEAKRRACRTGRKVVQGPAVRYHSVSMPIVEEIGEEEELEEKPENEMDSREDDGKQAVEVKEEKPRKQARTFLSFTDDKSLKESFPKESYRIPNVRICPITRLPAKYFDPVTQLPYANLQAFKILREAYYQQLEAKGDRNDPEVASWLEWRARNRPVKPILTSVNRPPPAFSTLATTRPPAPVPTMAAVRPAATTAKQSVVLPTRPSQPSTQMAQVTQGTTQPLPTTQQQVPLQTLKVTATPTTIAGSTPRTIATTTLTAAQLQQLAAARGQVFVNQLRAGQMGAAGVRQVAVGQIAGTRAGQIIGRTVAVSGTGPAIMRSTGQANAGLIVSQQPRQQTVTVQRPQVGQVGVAVSGGGGVNRVTAGRGQMGPGQLVVATTAPTRQHYVISGTSANSQIVALTGQPGQTVRPGQIVQVAGQSGQHQIVVSQSGQIVLQPPTTKQN